MLYCRGTNINWGQKASPRRYTLKDGKDLDKFRLDWYEMGFSHEINHRNRSTEVRKGLMRKQSA